LGGSHLISIENEAKWRLLAQNKSDPKHISEREGSSVVKTEEWSEKEARRGGHGE